MSENQRKSGYTNPPFEAYLGNDPYAFVSYAHQDIEMVYPEITKWSDRGFNIWYDEGISAAGEWLEEIAEAIGGCSLFIVMISPRSVLSQFVKNEILYALDKSRPFLAIHLEQTGLPKGLELCMSGHQALRMYELEETRYYRKLDNVLESFLHSKPKIEIDRPPQPGLPGRKVDTRILWPGVEAKLKEQRQQAEESVAEQLPEESVDLPAEDSSAPAVEAPPELEEEVISPAGGEVSESDGPGEERVLVEAIPQEEEAPQEERTSELVELQKPAGPMIVGEPAVEPLQPVREPLGLESPRAPDDGETFLVREVDYRMLWVAPGSFSVHLPWIGEREEVEVSDGFWLGERLITQGDYLRIVGRHTNYFWDSDSLPAEQVSWLDCIEFCKALTALERRERRLPEGYEFRLPLEIEWEYACRAGTETTYFFGTNPDELFDFAWVRGNSKHRTHPVQGKKPNPWGFYDLYGNVREWVHDSYYTSINEGLAGEIPDEFRISRGGGYMARRRDCNSSCRETNSLFHRFRNLGFRIALSKSLPVD